MLPFFIEWSAGTTHPSLDAPSGCHIVSFSLAAPNDPELQRLCTLLDLDVSVSHSDLPHLTARISGPDGRVLTLAS